MKISLNKEIFVIPFDVVNIEDLIKLAAPRHPIAAVKVNGVFIKREEYGTFFIKENDTVIFVHMLGGG
ncbi:MoaD/ThiS family protein [candidate division WOR-3 bacterium]|nr:MoaD/ThiS family protein [candidate division WOR-3 bacterium]